METEKPPMLISNHPKIVGFFKDREQADIDDILLSLIGILEKMEVSSVPNTHVDETVNSRRHPTESLITINRYVLDEINKEYMEFLRNRDSLVGIFKESTKQSLGVVDAMRMPYLEKYICETCDPNLGSKLQLTNQFKCELCNYYICNTRKSLSAHQRGCKKYVGSL